MPWPCGVVAWSTPKRTDAAEGAWADGGERVATGVRTRAATRVHVTSGATRPAVSEFKSSQTLLLIITVCGTLSYSLCLFWFLDIGYRLIDIWQHYKKNMVPKIFAIRAWIRGVPPPATRHPDPAQPHLVLDRSHKRETWSDLSRTMTFSPSLASDVVAMPGTRRPRQAGAGDVARPRSGSRLRVGDCRVPRKRPRRRSAHSLTRHRPHTETHARRCDSRP